MDRELARLLKQRLGELKNSPHNMETIYRILFSDKNRIAAEENDGYRIRKYTFGQIQSKIQRVSASLHKQYGAKGAFVGIEMENSADWIVAFWSILRSGNKPYLINLRHSHSLAEGLITSLNIDAVLCVKPGSFPVKYYTVADLDASYDGESFAGEFADELAISTSATTLKQVVCYYGGKQIATQLLNSGDIVKNCPAIASTYHGNLKQLAFLPFYHIFGLSAVYFWFAFFGCCMVFLPNLAPETITKTCRKHEVTHIFAVPLFWHSVEDQLRKELAKLSEKEQKKFEKASALCTKLQNVAPRLGQKITLRVLSRVTDSLFGPSVRFCISGGSYIRQSALELLNAIGCSLHNGYGMSEVGITSVDQRGRPKELNQNAIGRPFGAVSYKISEEGTLLIKGDSICSGISVNGQYRETGEWYDSRDVVICDQGNYYIKGRLSDLVIGQDGENINPDVVEKEFCPVNALRFSVIGLPVDGEETLCIVVQVSPKISQEELDATIASVYATNATLPSAVQAFYITYDDIAPANAIKVGRSFVKKGLEQGTITLIPFKEAKAQTVSGEAFVLHAEEIKQVLAEVLNVAADTVNEDTNILFELGATSLQYFSVVTKLEEKFHVSGFLESEKKCCTVREFSEFIERHTK